MSWMINYILCPLPTLSYVRSGFIALNDGALRHVSYDGHGWSSRGGSSNNVYYLGIDAVSVFPSYNGSTRYLAFLVRFFI